MTRPLSALILSAALMLGAAPGMAQMMHDHNDHQMMEPGTGDRMGGPGDHGGHHRGHHGGHHHGHGPIGVMGNHVMPRGKFMLSYRFGRMEMSGLRFGTNDLSADRATNIPNRFAGMPGMPPTLRVIPHEMSMTMHMFGAIYGATDRLTLMAMLPYVRKDMTMITYQGATGTTVLGRNKVSTEGLGDIRIAGTYGLYNAGRTSLTATLGLSLPTGSITEKGRMLSPMNMRHTRRLGYNMQLGSGTFDLYPALSYQSGKGKTGWGGQVSGIIRLGENDEGYARGNEAALTAWISYRAAPWVSLSGRIEGRHVGKIDGIDRQIMGPAPGANPDFIGGDSVTLFAGADFSPQRGALKGHRIGLEIGVPVYEDLNGPMLRRDWQLALAWRKGF